MCKWGNEVILNVPIMAESSHTGEVRWVDRGIDRCIAPIVQALNDAGILTGGSCCGHGQYDGFIGLHDGRMLVIKKDIIPPEKRVCTT